VRPHWPNKVFWFNDFLEPCALFDSVGNPSQPFQEGRGTPWTSTLVAAEMAGSCALIFPTPQFHFKPPLLSSAMVSFEDSFRTFGQHPIGCCRATESLGSSVFQVFRWAIFLGGIPVVLSLSRNYVEASCRYVPSQSVDCRPRILGTPCVGPFFSSRPHHAKDVIFIFQEFYFFCIPFHNGSLVHDYSLVLLGLRGYVL